MNKSASNGRPGRRERRKEETRRLILQTAMKLFEKKGVFQTTVEEITEAADIGKGTFFNYFSSKEAILSSLAESQLAVMRRAALEAKNADTVRPILMGMCRELSSNPGRSPILLRSLLGTLISNPPLLNLLTSVLKEGREHIATILKRGQRLGEIRRDIEAGEIARCLQQVAFGTNFIWSVSNAPDLAAWQMRSMDLFWRGIAARPEVTSLRGPRKG
jgi:AcrR family transcriptional regulator